MEAGEAFGANRPHKLSAAPPVPPRPPRSCVRTKASRGEQRAALHGLQEAQERPEGPTRRRAGRPLTSLSRPASPASAPEHPSARTMAGWRGSWPTARGGQGPPQPLSTAAVPVPFPSPPRSAAAMDPAVDDVLGEIEDLMAEEVRAQRSCAQRSGDVCCRHAQHLCSVRPSRTLQRELRPLRSLKPDGPTLNPTRCT